MSERSERTLGSLTVQGVTWTAGGTTILDDIDVAFKPGLFTGIIGPNGSGKTSLLHLLAGVNQPSSGLITLDGEALASLRSRERARRVALLEQHAETGLDLTARDVVELGRIPHRSRWPGAVHDDAETIERAMRRGRVSELGHRRWATLSGGERQRVQLARALAQEPEVLLLDEPTNHLDLGHQIAFLRTLRETAPTAIAALHDLDLAAAYCDELIVMQGGRILAQGATDDVLTAELIREVYGVEAVVETHPVARRRTIVWIAGGEHACRRPS